MKRKLSKLGIVAVFMLMLMFSSVLPCNAGQTVEVVDDGTQLIVKVNGKQVNCDQQPYITNGCTMVPVSIIAQQLGATVDWHPETMTVTIKGEKLVVLTIGSPTATIDGSPINLLAPAIITGGRTMVPLRFVSEALGAEVVYTKVGKPVSNNTALNMKVQEIIAKIIKPNMQDIDKAFAIFQYIRNNSLYGNGPHSQTAYGNLIEGVSVNEGYVDAFHVLCDAAGLENYVVNGRIGGFPHAWNIVKIGDQYYHIDLVYFYNPDLPITFYPKNDQQLVNERYNRNYQYQWDVTLYPKCEGRAISLPPIVDYISVHNGYIYCPTYEEIIMLGAGKPKDIYKMKLDGSENVKAFTTKHGASVFAYDDQWIYYSGGLGPQVYKVRYDGSDETKLFDQNDIFDNIDQYEKYASFSGMYVSNGYLFLEEMRYNNNKSVIIYRINLETNQKDKIIIEPNTTELFYVEHIGEYIYYKIPENGVDKYYKVTLDGKQKTLLID